MRLAPPLRSSALTAHVVASVGWLGSVMAYLALTVTALMDRDIARTSGILVAMEVILRVVIVPLSISSLATGVLQAITTPWGLLRHYWVVFKLALTLFATVVLLLHRPQAGALSDVAFDGQVLAGLQSELLHAGVGLLVLLATTVLSVFKPKGLTPYGWRFRTIT
jgi:hypothetical protein